MLMNGDLRIFAQSQRNKIVFRFHFEKEQTESKNRYFDPDDKKVELILSPSSHFFSSEASGLGLGLWHSPSRGNPPYPLKMTGLLHTGTCFIHGPSLLRVAHV